MTNKKNGIQIGKIMNKYMIYLLLLLIIIISSFASPVFLKPSNLINVFKQVAIYALIAYPITCLIISGVTDLSAGSVCAFTGVAGVSLYVNLADKLPSKACLALAILYSLVLGCLIGVLNGFIVTRLNVPAFMATLATMEAFRGGALLYTKGDIIYGIGDIAILGQGQIGRVPISMIIMLVMFAIFWVLLNKTVYGRSLYAVGGNEDAALASGINVRNVRWRAYVIQSTMCGLAGIILMGRLNSGQPTAAQGYEFDAIIGAILGGTSFSGGQGTMLGTLVGILIVGIINNILQLCGVQSYIHQIVKGVIIVVAVAIDMRSKINARKIRRKAASS